MLGMCKVIILPNNENYCATINASTLVQERLDSNGKGRAESTYGLITEEAA